MITRRRLLVGLWAVAVALAVAVVLGVSGLWSRDPGSARPSVARYITDVNAIQQQMRLPLARLKNAYDGLSTRRTNANTTARLAKAEATLETLQRQLAALPAPPAAAKLRALLLKVVRQEIVLARELHQLALFLPRFQTLLAAAKNAGTVLGRQLAAVEEPKAQVVQGTAEQIEKAKAAFAAAANRAAAAQAKALDGYTRTLAALVRKLRPLEPPPVRAPARRAELHRLGAARDAGVALARELRKQDRSRVPALTRAFQQALRLSGSLAAQRSQIAAVKAYNDRVRQVSKGQAQVENEIIRLQRTLA